MRDGLGTVQSVLLLGGTSDIGVAAVRQLARGNRLTRVVLAARDLAAVQVVADSLVSDFKSLSVSCVGFDACTDPTAGEAIDAAFSAGPVDCVINAAGLLGTDIDTRADLAGIDRMLTVNYTSAVLSGSRVISRFTEQGFGTLVVISSVAAERARGDNYVYASTKAGLDAWAAGLADSLADEPIDVVVVRPGFVHTKMTAGLKVQPMSVTPEQVGIVISHAIAKRTPLVWAPATVRPLMSVMRHLPRPVFRAVSKRAAK